jgi:hypothetical protein
MHRMPAWFRVPLANNAKAMKGWKALIPSRKKDILRYLSNLTSAEARARNIARTLRAHSRKT